MHPTPRMQARSALLRPRKVPLKNNVFRSVDAAIAEGGRDPLCQLLAGLLSREAIVRALLDESGSPPSSFSQAVTGGDNAQAMGSKK